LTHEAIGELEKICGKSGSEFTGIRPDEHKQPKEPVSSALANLRNSLLAKAIVQKKIGDHE
jgi:hypothetical protein